MNREAFEKWFKELYVKRGYVSSKAELEDAWQAAKTDSAAQVEAIKEQCAVLCETECAQNDGITCAESIREMRIEP